MIKVPLNAVTFGDEEINAAIGVLKSGMVTMGARCQAFEKQFAEYLGVRDAIFVNSGSSANLLAFFALANFALPGRTSRRAPQPGDEIIVPALTWSTTIWPVVQAGFVPVLVDCDPTTLQMRPENVEAAIGPRTIGVCPVHVLGNAVAMNEIQSIAAKHDLWVVEDTCESLGTKHSNRQVGTFGDMGTYSFFFSHHMTTIEGGMIVTNDADLGDLLRCLRAHGWTRNLRNRQEVEAQYPDLDPRFLFVNTGFNVRPTEINAAFGEIQLRKLAGFNERRREIAEEWCNGFADLSERGDLRPMQPTPSTEATWFGFPVLVRDTKTRNALRAHLEQNGIETRPVICGNLQRQPVFKHVQHRVAGSLEGADRVMDCGLFWGSHPVMNARETNYVVEVVKDFFATTR